MDNRKLYVNVNSVLVHLAPGCRRSEYEEKVMSAELEATRDRS